MLREWVSSQYLGHQNLKNALDAIKRSFENVALSTPGLIIYPDTMTSTAIGLGTRLRVVGTFMYRIEDVIYLKGLGITQAINTGDSTPTLIPHDATDNTASGGYDVAAGRYRAGVLMINAAGTFTRVLASTTAGVVDGVSAGGRLRALGHLLDELDTDEIDDQAIVSFFVIGDGGATAFTSTSSLTIATNLDLYQLGGMALSTGQSTDGNQILGLL